MAAVRCPSLDSDEVLLLLTLAALVGKGGGCWTFTQEVCEVAGGTACCVRCWRWLGAAAAITVHRAGAVLVAVGVADAGAMGAEGCNGNDVDVGASRSE